MRVSFLEKSGLSSTASNPIQKSHPVRKLFPVRLEDELAERLIDSYISC
jgi:hypothetical protein